MRIETLPGAELAVERTMRWGDGGYGAHTEKASLGVASQWYFAEGAQGFFSTYFLLVNPEPAANTAHVTYFRENAAPVVRAYALLPSSRRTIDASDDPELVNQAFGARVEFDKPGMAERAMYFGATPLFAGGHGSAGAAKLSTQWFLAEGATGTYFTTFVLMANPGDQPANVTLTYLPASGAPVVKQVMIPAGQRVTRNVAGEDTSLEHAAVGVRVESDRPIVVERSQYWPGPAADWYEAHNSFGLTETGQHWGLAEGHVGGAGDAQTYILLANPGTNAAEVDVAILTATSSVTPLVKHFTVPPTSRFNVGVTGPGSVIPELANEAFGAEITSTQPIVVERSLYTNVDGVTWAAGTNATATPFAQAPPIAVVGPDQVNVPVGTTVTLQGIGGPPYQWTLISKPAGSTATLSGATTATPTFVVDLELTGTAFSGPDYLALPAPVVFPDNQASMTVTITPAIDNVVEGAETVIATLIALQDYKVGPSSTAMVTIVDND